MLNGNASGQLLLFLYLNQYGLVQESLISPAPSTPYGLNGTRVMTVVQEFLLRLERDALPLRQLIASQSIFLGQRVFGRIVRLFIACLKEVFA